MVHYYIPVATANIEPMSYPSGNHDPNSASIPSSGFNSQSQMGLAEVLQMCCLSHRSGQITFRSGESYGFVYIQHGKVLHAMCGVIEGEEAVYLMLSWPGGGFSLDEGILPHKKTVALTWEQLLFEGARRADVGMAGSKSISGPPVTTIEPVASSRAQDSQPKLTVMRPDMPPSAYDLEEEYTHVGRAAGNEIPLPYPSVSNRHCIFILSGPDIVLRDLNSSNGTLVNNQPITETVLRPGDLIQVGDVQIKFEPGIKRPKLSTHVPPPRDTEAPVPVPVSGLGYSRSTVKLPPRSSQNLKETRARNDSDYVQGVSAISYHDLAKPEAEKKAKPWLTIIIGGIVLVLVILGGAYYYFAVLHAS